MAKVNATLMNKNKPVLYLEGIFVPISNVHDIKIFKAERAAVEESNRRYLPIIIFNDNTLVSSFNNWFSSRIISNRRKDIPEGKIEWEGNQQHFFSLSDQYWLRYNDSEQWKDLNFFTNNYSCLTGDTFFTKNLAALNPARLNCESPDLTTNGIMKKRWKRDDNNINVLIKHSSKALRQEVLNEILASKLLSQLKMIPFVNYTMCIEGYDICSVCKNFITEKTELVPASHIFQATPFNEAKDIPPEEHTYQHLVKAINKYQIPDGIEFIDKMLIVDKMLMNDDRHLGNFGFLRNVETGEFIEPAPLYDFGNAFFGNKGGVNKNEKLFANRISYLFNNQSMQPVTNKQLEAFRKSMEEFSFVTNKQKNEIMQLFEENNTNIKNELLKSERSNKSKQSQSLNIDDDF